MTYEKNNLCGTLSPSFSLTAAAYNTYAPNSWDTVKKEAWDYQAVYDLCEKGRAPGYDVNFFNRGSLTRY